MFSYDERATSTLIEQVYAPEITLNYDTLLLGNGPETVPSHEWAKKLENLHDRFDTTQHIVQLVYHAFLSGACPETHIWH